MWSDGTCETDGVRTHFVRTGGPGPPVVLLHGLTGNGACWTPIARLLAPELDVVMPDARGHGGSDAPAVGYRYDDLAGDVLGLIGALGLVRPVLVGHSMGGMTAAVAAQRAGAALGGIVLVDPTFIDRTWQQVVWDSDLAEEHLRTLCTTPAELVEAVRARHPRRSPEIIGLQVAAQLQTSPQAFEVLRPPNPDAHDLVRSIDVPSVLVIGDLTVVSSELATELRGLNPALDVVHVPGAGHGLPFDEPERVAGAIATFLGALQ